MSKELNHSQNGSSIEDKAGGCYGAHPESQPSEGKEGGSLWVPGQPDSHKKFQASQAYIVRPDLKKKQKKKGEAARHMAPTYM